MRVKRLYLTAMVLSMGLLVVADSGVLDWTTAALADHHDDANDDNVQATDTDQSNTKVEAQHQGKQRCSERPNPRKCRRRRHKQERKQQKEDDRTGGGGGEDEGDAPPPAPAPEPEEECILGHLEDSLTYGPLLCDVYRELTPVFPVFP